MITNQPNIRDTSYRGDVYFALSWRSGFGQNSAWKVVRILDESSFRAIGDIDTDDPMDENRIRRIMKDCSGFVCVLPFREGDACTTSPYMLPEIRIAAEMEIPVIIFHEKRVNIRVEQEAADVLLSFPGDETLPKIKFKSKFYGPYPLEDDYRLTDDLMRIQIQKLLEVCAYEVKRTKPYAFFITRVQEDFAQVREAVEIAVHNEAGLACIWTSPEKYSDRNQQFQDRIKMLIKNAVFAVADISFSEENPGYYSPNRAHEIGMAIAYEKPIFLCSCEPRRNPYFSISDLQVIFWKDEKKLEENLGYWVRNNIQDFGRQVYNWQLPQKIDNYVPKITRKEFRFQEAKRFIPPSL